MAVGRGVGGGRHEVLNGEPREQLTGPHEALGRSSCSVVSGGCVLPPPTCPKSPGLCHHLPGPRASRSTPWAPSCLVCKMGALSTSWGPGAEGRVHVRPISGGHSVRWLEVES